VWRGGNEVGGDGWNNPIPPMGATCRVPPKGVGETNKRGAGKVSAGEARGK